MNGRKNLLLLVLLILLAPVRVLADILPLLAPATNAACRIAIAAAERAHGIPSHLLAAIARVESGRRDQASGNFNPWPWTINMDGQGSFYETKAEAVAAAVSMRSHAARSIDVGCMQISLVYHPDAFGDMNMAFDPASNADYGARFLVQLFQKTNSWTKAVEMYHSATPEIGAEYGRRVYAGLPDEMRLASITQSSPLSASPWGSPMGSSPIGAAIGSPMGRPTLFAPLRLGAPHIIPQAPGPSGGPVLGRSLEAYRSASVRFAVRAP